jgi:mannose-6-phosphate isomerase-like protein (cupin superfamily)
MAKIRIREEADCRLMTSREFLEEKGMPEADIAKFSDDALATRMRIFHEGDDRTPQLFETQVPPNAEAAVHCHEEDEIMYILDGEMILGNRSLRRGGSMFIAAQTMYGFKAGPEGVSFLNFRPKKC